MKNIKNLINLASIIGILIGLRIIFIGYNLYISFFLAMRPTDNILVMTVIFLNSLLFAYILIFLMLTMGILCCIDSYKTYLSRSFAGVFKSRCERH